MLFHPFQVQKVDSLLCSTKLRGTEIFICNSIEVIQETVLSNILYFV
jgi:hypothetical protein